MLLWLLLLLLLLLRRLWGHGGFGGVVDAESEGRRWTDGHNARAELYADGDIVVGRESTFAEAYCELRPLAGRL